MLKSQQELNFSQYTDLCDKLIPQNHLFRKINELIDFGFIREELKDKYCPDNGRTAEDPEYLFKFLFLKCLHPMSDVDLVERALYDISYKYFLGLNHATTAIRYGKSCRNMPGDFVRKFTAWMKKQKNDAGKK